MENRIINAIQKAYSVCGLYNNIGVSISGGADSDIMLDILLKVAPKEKFTFFFFDTGIEYDATKRHLDFLEQKYGIVIERHKAIVPVPLGCKTYGLPFFSKYVSDMIGRLQKHNFKWADKPLEELEKEYPNCRTSLRWWCNDWGDNSSFNIKRVKWLKEFLIANPPNFPISMRCCEGAKKNNGYQLEQERGFDLVCIGVRKAEGGIRAYAYTNCYDEREVGDTKHFRPIFWLTNEDRREYEKEYDIVHSDCYRVYGFKRTGCARCPYGRNNEEQYSIMLFEPKLYQATENIFGKSYEYTRKFHEFRDNQNKQIKEKTL